MAGCGTAVSPPVLETPGEGGWQAHLAPVLPLSSSLTSLRASGTQSGTLQPWWPRCEDAGEASLPCSTILGSCGGFGSLDAEPLTWPCCPGTAWAGQQLGRKRHRHAPPRTGGPPGGTWKGASMPPWEPPGLKCSVPPESSVLGGKCCQLNWSVAVIPGAPGG